MRPLTVLFHLVVAVLFHSVAYAQTELLDPEKAFQISAQVTAKDRVEVRLKIEKGYYLYREKTRVSAQGATLGAVDLPKGKVKQDEIFGQVEIWRDEVRFALPVKATAPYTLKITTQGCADAGLCYPPMDTEIRIDPSAPVKTAGPSKEDLLARLKALAGDLPPGIPQANAPLLPAEEAFKLAIRRDGNTITAQFGVAKDYYLYRDKVHLTVKQPQGTTLGKISFPKAEEKDDPTFGRMAIYRQDFTASAQLQGGKPGGTVVIEASWQGCNEASGICYPPLEQQFTLTGTGTTGTTANAPATSESDSIASLFKGGSFWMVVASFFGFGLLLALTPCVFPMIPILSGIIVGHGDKVTKTHGFLLSVAYVLGMAITYAVAGVAAGLSGTLISTALQTPWALGTGAAIFVLLSLSMFGFYELQLPSALQSRMTEASNRLHGGHFTSVFGMGALSALIVGPCVAAPLAGALIYIGQTGDIVLGGVSLFAMALGMGVPLLLIGLSAGALLPKAGGWMDAVKRFFGVLLLAVAIWLIQPLLPAWGSMLLWAALLIPYGVHLGALDHTPVGWPRLWKSFGVIILTAGMAFVVGVMGGSRDILQPLAVFAGGSSSAAAGTHLQFTRVKSVAELDAAIARNTGKPVMLDFYADWCVSCKEMENITFADPRVQAALQGVVLLQADVTANSEDDKALLKRFGLFGPPGILFFDRNGKQNPFKVIGYEKPEAFLESLKKALAS
ncbi:MAG: protein-disulfide reductase DsbD [Betaproteobacteria bacterium]|nr:protein-disulfide reductase DsbD [Betaproteobacteria bacterium]